MTCVLCGAGAETSFGLSNGANFAMGVLGIEETEMNKALDKYYENLSDNWAGKRYKKNPFSINDLFGASIRKQYISGESKIISIKNMDEYIESQKKKLTKEEKIHMINEHTSYMGIIDEHFHTIINPIVLGPEKFWRVVDCYNRAYLLLVSQILNMNNPLCDDYLRILENPVDILAEIKKTISEQQRFYEDSYYARIEKHPNVKVVTTNYTPICDAIITRSEIIHIHGELGLFEVPYEWRVFDAKEIMRYINKQVFFPYIFIQSGIKPIVEKRQIRVYNKLLDAFEAKKIVVLGYRINCDDNHINGLLRSAYMNGSEIVYMDFVGGASKTITINEVSQKLRISSPSSKLRIVHMDNTDCLDKFENELQ